MPYAIPGEVPRSRFARFATWPLIPIFGGLVIGTLPAITWMIANAWFLGCRDAWRQTRIAVSLYLVVKLAAATARFVNETGLLAAHAGIYAPPINFLFTQINWLTYIIAMSWLQGRQDDAAHYLSSVQKGLWWGLPIFALLIPANYVMFYVIRNDWPYVSGFWGAQSSLTLLNMFGIGDLFRIIAGQVFTT